MAGAISSNLVCILPLCQHILSEFGLVQTKGYRAINRPKNLYIVLRVDILALSIFVVHTTHYRVS